MSSPDVFALSIHADYRCRHSGACCSADWDVPVELPVYRTLEEAVAGGRLQPQAAARHLVPFVVEPDLPEDAAAMLERTDAGECVFLERETKLCIVHRDMGRSGAAGDVPVFSPTRGSRRPRHVHHVVALLSDGGVDVVPRRLSPHDRFRTACVPARRLRRADRHRQRSASASFAERC